jgi:hypothetical protein
MRLHPFTSFLYAGSRKGSAEEMRKAFHWTRSRMTLLTELLCLLSATIREWNTFLSPDGDVDYFSDLDEFPSNSRESRNSEAAGQSLRSIKQTFQELENFRHKLLSLEKSLSSDFSTVRTT